MANNEFKILLRLYSYQWVAYLDVKIGEQNHFISDIISYNLRFIATWLIILLKFITLARIN